MKRLLIIGCGDIALRTLPLLTGRYRVFALIRNAAYAAKLRALGVTPILGDLDDRQSLMRIGGLADVVLHLAPPNTEQSPLLQRGVESRRRSRTLATRPSPPLGKRGAEGGFEFTDSRTRQLLAALSLSAPPQHFIYISTSGVYGDCGGALVSETHPTHPQNARALRRVDAENQIRVWARRNRVNASILRVPGIYAADRLPLERIRQATPAIVASEDGYTNHIHADDLAQILVAALRHGKPNRVYHAVDDGEMKMGDYFDVVADAFNLPRSPRISRAEAQRVLSPVLLSFMNESRRLTNQRMKRELKVELRYPTVAIALKV